MKRLVIFSLSMFVAVFTAATLLFQISRTPSFSEIKARYRSQDKVVLDRHGQVIDEVRVENRARRSAWIGLHQVNPVIIEALLRAQDRRFFYHPGYDLLTKTITMQVADWIGSQAFALELKWSKREILETYINLVRVRGELQGVGAASYALFDKAAAGLTRPEAAVLAALIRAPDGGVKQVRAQACVLLRKLGYPEQCGLVSESHLNYIEQGYRLRPYMRMAPLVGQRLAAAKELKDSTLVRSTLDRRLQWRAIHSLQMQIAAAGSGEGAVVVIENSTGHVLAYVGHTGSNSKVKDAAVAARPAGSTLKALIFAKAMDERILTAASEMEESFEGSRDRVNVRSALAKGLNIPAARALELLGVENFVGTMAELGFTGLSRAGYYGPSLALGSAEINLLELTNAYRTLANGGIWSPVSFSPDVPSDFAPKNVFSAEAAFITGDILKSAATNFWSAAGVCDQWCVGYSSRYTVGVWTGVAGTSVVWREIMEHLHRAEPSEPPRPTPELVRLNGEWYLKGTEPGNPHLESADLRSRFSYPVDQATIQVGTESGKNHRLFIQIVAPKNDQNVYLNNRRLGRAQAFLPWQPRSGRYTLELRDSRGSVLDKVTFMVRGRNFASAP